MIPKNIGLYIVTVPKLEPKDNQLSENKYFLLGNAVLVVALLMLVNIDSLWDKMGAAAMGLWIAVFGLGVYLMYRKPKE